MTRAVKAVTTYRGRDPRDFTLVAFGGNGPVVGVEVARALSIAKVLVPPAPGVFSALGLLMSEVEHEFSLTLLRRSDEMNKEILGRLFLDLESRAKAEMQHEVSNLQSITLRRLAGIRYAGQAYELTIPVMEGNSLADVETRFHDEHRATYGHGSDRDPIEVVSLHVYAKVNGEQSGEFAAGMLREVNTPKGEAKRTAYFGRAAGFAETPVLARSGLTSDWRPGPLIIEEYDATCVIPPDARARLDKLGNIEIELVPEAAS
jgi:N-methylhydantoinase A